MQYLTRRAHPEWSLARQMAHAQSTAEGWAHYAEQMMVEQGLGDGDPKLKIAQIEMALLRGRFIASIEMHTKGKSVDDAMQVFMKECGSPEPEATSPEGDEPARFTGWTCLRKLVVQLGGVVRWHSRPNAPPSPISSLQRVD